MNPIPVVSFDKISLFSIALPLLVSIAFHVGGGSIAPIPGMIFLPLPVIGFAPIVIGGVLDVPPTNRFTGTSGLAIGIGTGFLSSVILGARHKQPAAITAFLLTFHGRFLLHESLRQD
jgi:hypothetical protein